MQVRSAAQFPMTYRRQALAAPANPPMTSVEPPPPGYNPHSPEAVKAMAPISAGLVGGIAGIAAGLADGWGGAIAGAVAMGTAGVVASCFLGDLSRLGGDHDPDMFTYAFSGAFFGGGLGALAGAYTSHPLAALGMGAIGALGAGYGAAWALKDR